MEKEKLHSIMKLTMLLRTLEQFQGFSEQEVGELSQT
jgi:hypothetical protein